MTNHNPSLMPLENNDGCIGGTWCGLVMGGFLMRYGIRHTLASASHWQDVREGDEAGEVFDGGDLVEGSGQVVVVNHCCCLMRPQAWEDLTK